jgi:hypothetical protein
MGSTHGRSLGLLLERVNDTFKVIAHARGRRIAGGVRFSRPSVAPMPGARPGWSEIVGVIADGDGRTLAAYAWPSKLRTYHETRRTSRGSVSAVATRDIRKLQIPIEPEGEFLVLYESALLGVSKAPTLKKTLIRAFRLRAETSRTTPTPAAFEIDGLSGIGDALTDLEFSEGTDTLRPGVGEVPEPGGNLSHVVSLDPSAVPDHRFDVVIMADGFTERELPRFETIADGLIAGLRRLAPFEQLDAVMSYHKAFTVSKESGLPVAGAPRQTYFFGTTDLTNWGDSAFIGSAYPELVQRVAAEIAPWSQIDLAVVIANVDLPRCWGTAYPEHRIVYTYQGRDDSEDQFVRVTAHEIGHVIAGLADEYIAYSEYWGWEQFPNVWYRSDLDATPPDPPWRSLAHPDELDGEKRLAVVYDYPNPYRKDGDDKGAAGPRGGGRRCAGIVLGVHVRRGGRSRRRRVRRLQRA